MSGLNTISESEECDRCERSISERSASIHERGCPFCRGDGE